MVSKEDHGNTHTVATGTIIGVPQGTVYMLGCDQILKKYPSYQLKIVPCKD